MRLLITTLTAIAAWAGAVLASEKSATKPNIIIILTDDQDLQLNSMNYMQGVKTHLTDAGTYFNHHFATISLCCPSRANMWTGKAAHNTNVTDLQPPYGEIQ
jgi:N-acetylglucosamine-6-sulfatase